MLLNTLLIALKQLSRNKTRTALTSLGILIGVASVIAMLSIGRGATASVNEDLSGLGRNLLFIFPGSSGGPGSSVGIRPFTEADVAAISTELPGVGAVAPTSTSRALVVYGDAKWPTQVSGITAEYLTALDLPVEAGRALNPGELKAGSDVCLLGRTVVQELFGGEDPLGRSVLVGNVSCRVVGTLRARGRNTFGIDQDDYLLMPLRTFQRRIQGSRDIGVIFIWADLQTDNARLKEDLEQLMRERRRIREGAEPDFTVRDMGEMMGILQNIADVLTGFLAAIAAVSLLVGGIGIMNIMMVSVTERTREIGIRLAIGAYARDVLWQFLVEAAVLSAVGGIAGIGLGLLITWGASRALDIVMVVDPLTIGAAFAFSAFIGVVFGYFPARRAAKMNPIDALRHE